jgi:hypothetical protein
MKIDDGVLLRFVNDNGDVSVIDSEGKVRRLQSGDPDSFHFAEKADRFLFEETWYTRAEFKRLIRQRMRRSSNNEGPDVGWE